MRKPDGIVFKTDIQPNRLVRLIDDDFISGLRGVGDMCILDLVFYASIISKRRRRRKENIAKT